MPNLMDMTNEEVGEALRAQIIAEQNDAFRQTLGGGMWRGQRIEGQMVMTSGVRDLGAAFVQAAARATMAFDSFTEDNDPHGDHDFGVMEIAHEGKPVRVYWKIDLYDTDYVFGSDTPHEPAGTRRVLTLLLPSEW